MIARLVIALCVAAVAVAVVVNFANAQEHPRSEKRTPVATASMTLFFVVLTLLIGRRVGTVHVTNLALIYTLESVGVALTVLGTWINIKGRFDLKGNWGDQIRIYDDHSLVTRGVYHYIRHPLYSGLFFMGYGASIAYANALGVLLMSAVFVPMMFFRARQEEVVLSGVFAEYADYKKRTGMFLPKILGRK